MDWKTLIDLRGLNYWLLASGLGLNLIWTFLVLLLTLRLLIYSPGATTGIQLGLMIAIFAGAFLVGWLIGKWAGDNRGPTYGLLSSLSSAALILFIILPTGILGLLVAFMALAGGLNGGLISLERRN